MDLLFSLCISEVFFSNCCITVTTVCVFDLWLKYDENVENVKSVMLTVEIIDILCLVYFQTCSEWILVHFALIFEIKMCSDFFFLFCQSSTFAVLKSWTWGCWVKSPHRQVNKKNFPSVSQLVKQPWLKFTVMKFLKQRIERNYAISWLINIQHLCLFSPYWYVAFVSSCLGHYWAFSLKNALLRDIFKVALYLRWG